MSIKEDTWLSSVMERPVFRVDAKHASDAAAVREHLAGRTGYYYAKVDAADVALTKELLRAGFFIADVNVTFAVAPQKLVGRASASVTVGTLPEGSDRARVTEDVLAIAHDTFRFTRFHLDPLVSKATADLVKKEWVRNYASGKRGDHLFVATANGKTAGFLAALKGHDGATAIIDLVGVHPEAQRQGVGRSMIVSFAEHYRDVAELLVGTQVVNTPSVQLYESLGFRLKSSQYVLHMHVREGELL